MNNRRRALCFHGTARRDHDRRVDLCSDWDSAAARSCADASPCNLREDVKSMPPNIYFPYQFDGRGRTREASLTEYVRQLVEQVLFTSPGERVNLPDFGSGLLQLPFAPNSLEMAAATQFTVQGALQKWLSAFIKVVSVVASANEPALTFTVTSPPPNTALKQARL